jgi:hypothetical protein
MRSHGEVKVVVTGGGVHLGGVNGSAIVQVGASLRTLPWGAKTPDCEANRSPYCQCPATTPLVTTVPFSLLSPPLLPLFQNTHNPSPGNRPFPCPPPLPAAYHQTVDGPLDVRFEALAPATTNTLATRRGRVELLMVRACVFVCVCVCVCVCWWWWGGSVVFVDRSLTTDAILSP